ncbi:heterokaryon incompatibility protein-domain-containing protein [Cladorrhinum sp. PSN332]|nr:heterokaryon incompatibility protein-domain-containing protein [Cladorrhinum sp. PSN332]
MPEFIDPGMPYHGVSPHLTPFLPYVEKADSSDLEPGFRMPGHRLSVPIDINRLKAWLDNCDANHHCNVTTQVPPDAGHAAWLVDVSRRCIVPFNHKPYIALSYVWGRASSMFLSKSNLNHLRTPGALDDNFLPKTIRDAMTLVASLGLTYLWIDRLCIVQDDASEKQAQIQFMASIYASSYFTLIAAQSHDAAGPLSSRPLRPLAPASPVATRFSSWLSGFKSRAQTLPPSPLTDTPWRGPRTNREVLNLHCIDLLRTVWFSRGWTFQEWLFSRRRIIFHSNTVNWECHVVAMHETQPLDPPSVPPSGCIGNPVSEEQRNLWSGGSTTTWANFHRYVRLAALFSPRVFTYPDDVHDAFAGAAGIFGQVFEGGLITGLPAQCFDQALIWQPYCPMKKRKELASDDGGDMTGEPVMPTWSWMSYQGNVQSESLASGWAYLYREDAARKGGRWLVRPTVVWEHNEQRLEILKPWETRKKMPDEVPEGWVWHCAAEGGDGGLGYFTTSRVPGQRFTYPIPLTNDPARVSHQSRFLRCPWARLGMFELDPKAYSSFAGECAVLAILDPDSKEFIGCLRLNRSEQDIRGQVPPYTVYLVELSEGFVELSFDQPPPSEDEERVVEEQTKNKTTQKQKSTPSGRDLMSHPLADVFDEWSLPHWDLRAPPQEASTNVYEFVNVMWITHHINHVVERIAVGRVDKRCWEKKAVLDFPGKSFAIK